MSDPRINFENFQTFVDQKPHEKVIDHFSWDSCAVGDFFEFVTGSRNTLSLWDTRLYNELGNRRIIVNDVEFNLRNVIGNGKCSENPYIIATYGDLGKALKESSFIKADCDS